MLRFATLLIILFVGCLAQNPTMNLVLVDADSGGVCNDGTPGGFYWRPGYGSGANRFVIHLQGGAWCYNQDSCNYRWGASPDLMSSNYWSPTWDLNSGLFSTNPDNNTWYNANEAYVMYCSSDVWSGNGTSQYPSGQQYQFRGKQIIRAVIDLLWSKYGLDQANQILFSGCSAGGQGVVVNIDWVKEIFVGLGSTAEFKGFGDAGWLQNFIPYFPNEVPTSYQMVVGYPMWNGTVDQNCAIANPGWEWLCYFSPYAYPYITTPIFFQTEQYDTYQVTSNCQFPPFNATESVYVQSIREAFVSSLQMVKNQNSYFSAACFHHCSSEDTAYNTVEINGYSLSQVLSNWYFETGTPTLELDLCPGFNCSVGCPANPY